MPDIPMVYIEAQRLFRKQKHGMDVVALEILQRLRTDTITAITLLVKDDGDRCIEESKNLSVRTLTRAFYPLWEQCILPAFLSRKRGLLHCTANTAPLWGKMPLVVTIHDLIYLEENYLLKADGGSLYQRFGNFYRRLVVPLVAKRAKHIVTVSTFQKDLIVHKLNIPASKVSVIYNGADERFFKRFPKGVVNATVSKYGITGPYILFLANTEPRKNTDGVLKAFARLCRVHPSLTHKLVIKGLKPEQLKKKLVECDAVDILSRIHHVGYIDYNDLPMIYQGAEMLWFPSFSEGFGLPIVEAMAGGVPVITSQCSVMPEIAGDAALYINPHEDTELVAQTFSILSNPQLRADLVEKGIARASKFTWKSAATQLATLYAELLQSEGAEETFLEKLAIVSPVLNKRTF